MKTIIRVSLHNIINLRWHQSNTLRSFGLIYDVLSWVLAPSDNFLPRANQCSDYLTGQFWTTIANGWIWLWKLVWVFELNTSQQTLRVRISCVHKTLLLDWNKKHRSSKNMDWKVVFGSCSDKTNGFCGRIVSLLMETMSMNKQNSDLLTDVLHWKRSF